MKTAFITGITGQDGSYLAELLLSKGYKVIGSIRKDKSLESLDFLKDVQDKIQLVEIDLTSSEEMQNLLHQHRPDEIYHLAAQTFAGKDEQLERETLFFNIGSTHNLLSKAKKTVPKSRVIVATSLHMYGNPKERLITTDTEIKPLSIYGISKATCQSLVEYYRDVEGLHCKSAILSNHESPRRGPRFVTQKIILAATRMIKERSDEVLELGNLDIHRDWGYAPEYVEGMWLANNQEDPADLFFATGIHHTVREFVELTFKQLDVEIQWEGPRGTQGEYGVDKKTGKKLVTINPEFFRPVEQDLYQLDIATTNIKVGWTAQKSLDALIKVMLNL